MTAIVDPRLDSEQMIFEGINTDAGPVYPVSEMARFFFARTNHWIRRLEAHGQMTKIEDDGSVVSIGVRRAEKTNGRIYTLSDIEEVAHGLAANGSISGTQLRQTLILLKVQGEMYKYL